MTPRSLELVACGLAICPAFAVVRRAAEARRAGGSRRAFRCRCKRRSLQRSSVSRRVGGDAQPPIATEASWQAPVVFLGHDGSEEAAAWLRTLMSEGGGGGPNVRLLTPLGEASPPLYSVEEVQARGDGAVSVPSALPWCPPSTDLPAALGRVFAILPDGRVLERLESKAWALQPLIIGTDLEWTAFDRPRRPSGEAWQSMYAWQYWRFLQPASTSPQALEVSTMLAELGEAASRGVPGQWWQSSGTGSDEQTSEPVAGSVSSQIAAMLSQHGFCVLDDFLPTDSAEAIAAAAAAAWASGDMENGVLTSTDVFARGDSVLWVNTSDPAAAIGCETAAMKVKEQHRSAAVPELAPLLEHVDAFIAKTISTQLPRAQSILTRSHAMFTCYPAAQRTADAERSQGYLRHVDNDKLFRAGRDNGRVLTTIFYLNPGWRSEDGGALRVFDLESPLQVRAEVLPVLNRLIVFWADEVPHEVLPPRVRDRFACTLWYLDRPSSFTAVSFHLAPAEMRARAHAAAAASNISFLD